MDKREKEREIEREVSKDRLEILKKVKGLEANQ